MLEAPLEALTAAARDSSHTVEPIRRGPWLFARSWVERLFLLYLSFFFLPFPLGDLPYTGAIGVWYGKAVEALVGWVARATLGIAVDPTPTGSGDTTFKFLKLATFLALALLAALAWTLLRRCAPVGARTRDLLRTYVRLGLAATLLAYGLIKLLPVQMAAPGPDRLLVPFGESSPMGLLWTFLGASAPYQIFSGVCEAAAGFLLLWRRTALLGALLGAAVLTNVLALNLCYDVPVKISSLHYLLMALFLLAPQAARLWSFLLLNRPTQPAVLEPFPFRRPWMRRMALALQVAFAAWLIIPSVQEAQTRLTTQGRLAPRGPLDGLYRVESFARAGVLDRGNADSARWVRMGIGGSRLGTILRADGRFVRYWLAVLPAKKTLVLASYDEPEKEAALAYSAPEPGLLRLEGELEGARTVVLLRREPETASLLMTRGFRWITEEPLNR